MRSRLDGISLQNKGFPLETHISPDFLFTSLSLEDAASLYVMTRISKSLITYHSHPVDSSLHVFFVIISLEKCVFAKCRAPTYSSDGNDSRTGSRTTVGLVSLNFHCIDK